MPQRRGKRWTASGYDKALGRKKHIGTFDTRKEAADAEADHRLRNHRGASRITCGDFASRWTAEYPRPRASTNAHNAERVKKFAVDFANVRMADVDRPTARRWALKHPSNVPAVRAMFTDAMNDGLVEDNPFRNFRMAGRRGRKDIVALTETELQALADVALDPRMELGEYGSEYRAQVLFSGYVGLRPGELFALPRENVNGDECLIERSLSRTGEIGPTKNGRSRKVVVPPVVQGALASVPVHRSGLLFTSPRGRMWTQPSHHRYWSLLRRFAGRPSLDYYELRHAAATMLIEREMVPWDVAVQLGHTDGGQLVMDLYGHPKEEAARARIIEMWGRPTGATPIRSGEKRENAS